MKPQLIVIVEDQPGRIGNLLLALSSYAESDLLDDVKSDAQTIVMTCATACDDNGKPVAWQFPPIVEKSGMLVICPFASAEVTLPEVLAKLGEREQQPGMCFLDLELKHDLWDEVAAREPHRFSAALALAECFGRSYGKLLVQSSSMAGGVGYEAPRDENYYNGEHYYAEEIGGAQALVRTAVAQYRSRYLSHNEHRVAAFIGFLWTGWVSEWDSARPDDRLHPFHHDWLQSRNALPTAHLEHIARFLASKSGDCAITTETLASSGGNSVKALFHLARNVDYAWLVSTDDCRDITHALMKSILAALCIAPVVAALSEGATAWRLPIRPGAAFLLALRVFLTTCRGRGTEPQIRIAGRHIDGHFVGTVNFAFGKQSDGSACQLISKYERVTNGNTTPPDGDADTCLAFYNLLRCKVELPCALMATGLRVYGIGRDSLEYEPRESDSDQVVVKWRIPV